MKLNIREWIITKNIHLHIEHPQAVAKPLRHKGTDLHSKERISVFEITPEISSFKWILICYHAIKICSFLIFLSWIFISAIENSNSHDAFFFCPLVINLLGTRYLQLSVGSFLSPTYTGTQIPIYFYLTFFISRLRCSRLIFFLLFYSPLFFSFCISIYNDKTTLRDK